MPIVLAPVHRVNTFNTVVKRITRIADSYYKTSCKYLITSPSFIRKIGHLSYDVPTITLWISYDIARRSYGERTILKRCVKDMWLIMKIYETTKKFLLQALPHCFLRAPPTEDPANMAKIMPGVHRKGL